METIRKKIRIRHSTIKFKELEKLNGQEVEVIIIPLLSKSIPDYQKKRFFQFEGTIESEFTDTSVNVDKLIYG